ncbi:TPA: BTB/POZ domain-containing protein kctd11 [Trebouxia sp. C0006]
MLARMFNETLPPSCQDKDGHYIIGRDGDTFKYILNYLRDGSCVSPVNYYTRAELLREADYYQVVSKFFLLLPQQFETNDNLYL